MSFKLRFLIVIIAALATMAPVCVLSGGDTGTRSESIELATGAVVEVIGENAEIRVRRAPFNTLKLEATLYNEEFVDFYTQAITNDPVTRFVISATTSTGGTTSASSLLEITIPEGIELIVRTTNHPIGIDGITVSSASLATVDGKISVTRSTGDFDLHTTNSEVVVQQVNGLVDISTTNAHVWFDGVVSNGKNSISTTNGDIAVRLRNGSNVKVSGSTHNGDVSINGGDDGVVKNGDTATLEYQVGNGSADLSISNGPGAIHINPDSIAVFDGDS
jgi:DUF4097 and DUF4098 domain-containing protein YvlB